MQASRNRLGQPDRRLLNGLCGPAAGWRGAATRLWLRDPTPSQDVSVISPPFLRGARDAFSFPAWVVGFSLLGVGSMVRDVGHPVGAAMLSTLLIWAGPAQV